MRSSLEANIPDLEKITQIPYPGLPEPHSQLAVPVMSADRVLGVLFVESPQEMQFGFEDEDMLMAMAGHLGAAIDLMQAGTEAPDPPALVRDKVADAPPQPDDTDRPLQIRRFAANNSIFIGDNYLIKGVAGAILWKLLKEQQRGRIDFSNRELRLDPSIGLPEVGDNLEARLVLLRRRLAEHGPELRVEKTARGLFRLGVSRPVELVEIA
jgi:hypothetical protein